MIGPCGTRSTETMIKCVNGAQAIIEAALHQNLVNADGKSIRIRLLPGLLKEELDELARTLPVAIPRDIRELLMFCSGIDGAFEEIDFSGRTMRDGFGTEFFPHGLPIAHDGFGNYWVVDLPPGDSDLAPIYYCSHDAPVVLLQSENIAQFVSEVFKMFIPPHTSRIDDVHEDRLFDVWRKNPGVMTHANAIACPDREIQTFAASLGPDFEIIDLRNAAVGMGFSWGRYGPRTEVKRFGGLAIFAYRKPEKKSLMSRLLGR